MRVKIFFKNYNSIPVSNQKELNSYIHRCIGKNNEYHDSFSNYSISSIQGGKLNKKTNMLEFESEPYIYISSPDDGFMQTLINGIIESGNKMFTMEYSKLEITDYSADYFCDTIITISPILLKRKSDGKKITVKDGYEEWLSCLQNQCEGKLRHAGINDKSFKLELRNPEFSKKKVIHVGNIFNPCSMVSLKVYGNKKTREYLYSVGLGNSCGSGFGSIKIYE